MPTRQCPECDLTNPPDAIRCDCGFDFKNRVKYVIQKDTSSTYSPTNEVVVKDIKMPFWSMVVFMVKWAIASIPAIIILTLITVFSISIFTGIITGMMQGLSKGVQ